MTDKRSILEQVKLDQEAFARLSPVQQQAAINELQSIGFNPGIEFGSSDDKLSGLVEHDVIRRSIALAICDESEGRWHSGVDDPEWREGYETGLDDATMFLREEFAKVPSPPNDADWRKELGWIKPSRRPTYEALQQQLTVRDEALTDIRNRILCPVGPAPSLDLIAEIAGKALSTPEGSD